MYLTVVKDIDFDSNPTKLFARGEFTKNKMTEVTQQLKSWVLIR
jgi:hypothetical protein